MTQQENEMKKQRARITTTALAAMAAMAILALGAPMASAAGTLVLHLPFDSAPAGLSPATVGTDATLTGATITTGSSGKLGEAMSLSAGNYAQTLSYKGIGGAAPRSLSMWIKSTNASNPNDDWFFGYGDAGSHMRFDFGMAFGSDTVYRFEYGGSFNQSPTFTDIIDTTWHHIGYTYSGTLITWYRDGVSVGTVSKILNTGSLNDVTIGTGVSNLSGRTFDGLIDEVAFYDDALTPAEMLAVYNAVASPAGPVDAAHSTLSPASANKAANGTDTQVITVQARDASDNNRGAGGDTVLISATAGSMGGVTDVGNGTYTATWTAPAVVGSGSATVTATLGGTAVGTDVGANESCVITLLDPFAPVLELPFDSEALSVSPASIGTEATLQNDAVVTTGDLGYIGEALSLDGNDDYAQTIGFKAIAGTSPRTASLWIKSATASAANDYFLSWGQSAGGAKMAFGMNGSDTELRVEGIAGVFVNRSQATDLFDTTWHHLAFTFPVSGVNTFEFYVDGQSVGTAAGSGWNTGSTEDLHIGKDFATAGRDFEGLIDLVRIHDYVLDDAQVEALYDADVLAASGPLAPTLDIADNSVYENLAVGSAAGSLSVANTNATFSFSLVEVGSFPDNTSFTLGGVNSSNVLTAAVFDKETKDPYSIRVLATETSGGSLLLTNTFTITVNDVAEAGGAMIARGEVQTGLTLAGTLEVLLDSSDSSVTYAVAGATYHGAMFEIAGSGDELHLKAAPSAGELADEYFVEVTATGNASGVYPPMLIKVTVVSGTPEGTIFLFN
jgi:hypothetical protein